jgi:DNA-binding CsgD family transcriptional regulator
VRDLVHSFARRIDAATPAERDRAVDALRACAILGVVLGHWLVTALVADGRTLRTASPLHYMPWLAPIYASADQLAEAVRVVAAGDALLAPGITRRLITEFSRLNGTPRAPLKERVGDLTERETEVLTLIAQGLSNVEIAERLVVAEQTVKTHVGRILVKLGLRDRTQAAVFAYESGLVRPSGY